LLGQQDVFHLLAKHSDVAAKYFKEVAQKVRQRRLSVSISLLGVVASVVSLFFSIIPFTKDKERDSFESQIQAVEANLNSLRALERNLSALKKELQTTSEESARIKREYEEALKLKAITAEQLEQIKKAVSAQSTMDTFLNYFFGFLLGVAGSILATVITDRWKARRALSGP
jgi:predicted PurR-regulated permease PerM